MPKKRPLPIADRDEVLRTFTSIMRGEMTEETVRKTAGTEERVAAPPKISERCKAAELLGKQYGLFDRREEVQPKGDTVAAMRAALEKLHDELADGGA